MKNRFKLLCVALAAALLFTAVLTSCEDTPDEPVDLGNGDGAAESVTEPQLVDELEGVVPYELTFTSNGDGTCAVTGLDINPAYTREFVLEIPEISPDGDTVTSIAWEIQEIDNILPHYMTLGTYDKILQGEKQAKDANDRELLFKIRTIMMGYDIVSLAELEKMEDADAALLTALDGMRGARIYSGAQTPPADFESGAYKNTASFYWYSETAPTDRNVRAWSFDTDIYGSEFPKMW